MMWSNGSKFSWVACLLYYFKSAGRETPTMPLSALTCCTSVATTFAPFSDLKSQNATLSPPGGGLHLQGQAVVSWGLVFAAVVLPIIHVNVVQLQEAHQISGRLHRERERRME